MTEYISREAMLKNLTADLEHHSDEGDPRTHLVMRRFIKYVEDFPAADVQPVKRGRWIDCTFYDPYEKSYEQNFEYKCSCCGHMIYNKPNDDNRYCGHCGARMDLEDGDTNG